MDVRPWYGVSIKSIPFQRLFRVLAQIHYIGDLGETVMVGGERAQVLDSMSPLLILGIQQSDH